MPETNQVVRIALDAMGGDYAPGEIIGGAVLAARENNDIDIALVGSRDIIERELASYNSHLSISCIEADGFITEGEHPAFTIRRKPNASVVVAAKMVGAGEAKAMISGGPTGATAASAILSLGLIPGIERPAVSGVFEALAPDTVIMDCGVNVDCKPQHILSFAIMGSVYARRLLNIANPTVALLSTGAEEGKGSQLVRESYALLRNSGLNFIGNIEGNDILSGRANVIICDGFIGNVILKFYESIGYYAGEWLKKKLKGFPRVGPARKLFTTFTSLTRVMESQSIGSGLLWGVNGVVFVMHGSIKAPQVAKTIAKAREVVKVDLVTSIKSELASIIPSS
jgi:glycerol-3-phosphate acyltransferase PlsX